MTAIPSDRHSKISKASVRLILLVLVYAAVLEIGYVQIISPNYAYMGYEYRASGLGYRLLQLMLIIVCTRALPCRIMKPSDCIYWLILIVIMVPALYLGPQTGFYHQPSVTAYICVVTVSFVVAVKISAINLVYLFPRISVSKHSIVFAVASVICVSYVILLFQFDFALSIPTLDQVYDVRADYKDELAQAGPFAPYVIGMLGNVLNPFLIALGLYRHKPSLVLLGLFGQIFLFSLTGYKSLALSVLVLLGFVALFGRGRRTLRSRAIVMTTLLLTLSSFLIDGLLNSLVVSSIFVRRLLVTPGLLSAVYVDFFDDRPKFLLSHSILEPFFDNPYGMSPARVIGSSFFGSSTQSANANLFADGYANGGLWGVVLAGIVLGVLGAVINAASDGLPVSFSSLLYIMPSVSLANSSVLTAILSHGIIWAVLLCAAIPRSVFSEDNRFESKFMR